MALLNYQQIGIAGAAVTYSPATATTGDTVIPDHRGFVHVKNGSGSAIVATLVIPGQLYGIDRPDVPISIPAGADRMISVTSPDFADPTTGFTTVICSAVTSVTIAAVRN